MLKTTVFVFVVGVVTKELLAAQVEVERKTLQVLPGDNATFMCRVGVPLQYCRIEIPGFRPYNLNKGSVDREVSYYGNGLDAGQCGFTIHHVEDKNNGIIKCTLGIPSEATESTGNMQLIVAKAPKQPELDLSRGTDSVRVYNMSDVLRASCIVRDGRPVANISWYLDNEQITDHGLTMPTVVDLAKENLQSKLQNLTKTLRPSDNGKFLKCVAFHPAYPGGYAEAKHQLDIKFAPQPLEEPIDRFGYQLGKEGLINLTIESNPQPRVVWTVLGERIPEGSPDRSGNIKAENVVDLGRGNYEVSLRIAAINKEHTEGDIYLTADNSLGSQTYQIKISTSPEPIGVNIGVGAIIGIVVAILIVILLVSILIFAKVSGRWCFSGGAEPRNFGESSDTESADVRPKDTKLKMPPIKLTSFFKKKQDKVSSEEEPETRQIETDESKPLELNNPPARTDVEAKEGLVYAELDLVRAEMKPVVKNDDEKTEYAEIVYTPQNEEEEPEKEEKEKESTKEKDTSKEKEAPKK